MRCERPVLSSFAAAPQRRLQRRAMLRDELHKLGYMEGKNILVDGPARHLGVTIQPTNVQGLGEFQDVFASMVKERANALIIVHSGFTFENRGKLLKLATTYRLPTMCEESAWANAGCLISYGPDVPHLARRGAYFVDKVLKGAKPADLPVEQPMKFELVINLKTAKRIGLTIPPNVLLRADKVIK